MDEPRNVTLFDLAVELLISLNSGSAAQQGPEMVLGMLESELEWLSNADIISLPNGDDDYDDNEEEEE